MIEKLEFSNFKVLRQATLPLGPFTLLVGPNGSGQRAFLLRTTRGHHRVPASDLSHGTLLVLAILTLAHISQPPPLVCLEEPGRGIHPRLLRDIRDAMYRLAYPEQFGEQRPPTQVIATTHSPYLLDLYRDHPEEMVVAQRDATGADFERLSARAELAEVLRETHLGDAWYSGSSAECPPKNEGRRARRIRG